MKVDSSGRGRWSALLVALALVAGGATFATPAQAGVGCWGDYCSGKDPQATGCGADAQTVAFENLEGARLELRWSPTCKTNWARYQQYPRGWYMGNAPLELRAVQDTGYTQRLSYGLEPPGNGTTTWSPMIYSPVHLVRAELAVWCGDATLVSAAFNCATEGVVKTQSR